jgi:hypothetical protein
MTTFGDQVKEFGGVPVSNNRYAGWFGNDVWYVDDIEGLAGNEGNAPEKAKKTIQEAVDAAGLQDTIFLRPRAIAVGAYHTHGYYSGSVIIDNALLGLSLIGTGGGGRRGWGANIQCAIEPDVGSTAATILVQAPGVSIENVMVKAITGSLGGGIGATNAANNEVYGLTISNCGFKDFVDTAAPYGSVHLDSVHWATIQHCIFQEGGVGVVLGSALQAIRASMIRDCDFWGQASDWANDIRVSDCKNIVIDNCRFNHALPTGGAPNIFIQFVGTAGTGIVSDCRFAHDTADEAVCMGLVGTVLNSNCYGADTILT